GLVLGKQAYAGAVQPGEQGPDAQQKAGRDTADREVSGKLMLAVPGRRVGIATPVAAENLDAESQQRQQPGGCQQPLERRSGGDVLIRRHLVRYSGKSEIRNTSQARNRGLVVWDLFRISCLGRFQ